MGRNSTSILCVHKMVWSGVSMCLVQKSARLLGTCLGAPAVMPPSPAILVNLMSVLQCWPPGGLEMSIFVLSIGSLLLVDYLGSWYF